MFIRYSGRSLCNPPGFELSRRAHFFGIHALAPVVVWWSNREKSEMEYAMGILLAFAPFIAFALVDKLVGPTQGLFAGVIVSATLLVRDWVTPWRMPKIFEIGTALLFGGLALYAAVAKPIWSVIGVRLCVDIGLLLIVLVSMAVGRPLHLAICPRAGRT